MPFRVSARTVLQLGAELISSDGIAFYELIKNAFDAGSPRVDIDIVIRINPESLDSHLEHIRSMEEEDTPKAQRDRAIEGYKESVLADVDGSAPRAERLKRQISLASSWEELIESLERANYIDIKDTGSGMSLKDLDEVYLTIGTRSRSTERERQREQFAHDHKGGSSFRPILGEKGIGRLSTMRLGWRLHVKTARRGEPTWNVLDIDWRKFSNNTNELIDDIEVAPTIGNKKDDPKISGTRIRISALTSSWSVEKLKKIVVEEFSRLTDPFVPRLRYPISLRINSEGISIPTFEKILFEHAHAIVDAKFTVDSRRPQLLGKVDYLMREREKTFSLELSDILSICDTNSPAVLYSLGPFTVKFFWFNRQALTAIDGIGEKRQVQKLVNTWSGGLMMFRDGFRVNPYGNPDDDWLDLDRKALASGGYKVNRKQIIGKVDISSLHNAALIDQTNREGIRDCDEKSALISLLKHILETQFRAFMNNVDKGIKAREPVTFDDLEERVDNEEKEIRQSLKILVRQYPQVKKDTRIITTIEDSIDKIHDLLEEAKQLADSFKEGRTELLHLAGLGLLLEILAHELNRATQHALGTLANADEAKVRKDTGSLLGTLEAQLKTLQKRLRILDPLSTSGRQVKENFELIALVNDILKSHEAQFKRHNIKYSLEVRPSQSTAELTVKMVKGMIVQILENLLSNSVYWLKQQRKLDRSFLPKIMVTIDKRSKTISLTDNGPGIPPTRKEEIFQPFVTTKPPGEGKGLGLYISREIAKYNKAALVLSDERTTHKNRLNTFILFLEGTEE
jgi:signal transduction histidine kinase